MTRLVIVSNRLPVTIQKQGNDFIRSTSSGGLATGLSALSETIKKIWIGWPGFHFNKEEETEVVQLLSKDGLIPVFLSETDIETYYSGFCNRTIWPHFHYFTQYTSYDEVYWDAYVKINQRFADIIGETIHPDDSVWIHDYQLMLVPGMLRKKFPDLSIGFFLHIPFPSYEIFRTLPWRSALLTGMLGADQVGFHTYGYMRHFLSATYRICGYEHHIGKITANNRVVNVDVFPMGIDYQKYAALPTLSDRADETMNIGKLADGKKIIISLDRLDYTKGIPQRIQAFATFLDAHPEYRGQVTLVLVVIPSRSQVSQYRELKKTLNTLVSEVNSSYGSFGWIPIHYLYRNLSLAELLALYQVADIALITPLRDGMNLVAKEYIASKDSIGKGVLILSEMTGAATELTEAILVNPHDVYDIVDGIKKALDMPESEQASRLNNMQARLKKYAVDYWAANFLKEQEKHLHNRRQFHINKLDDAIKGILFNAYKNSRKRLIILDYDGTLMPFHVDPVAVFPDQNLIALLNLLLADPGNKIVINSGRDRQTMEDWLGFPGLNLAAEHGVWLKDSKKWRRTPGLSNDWKIDVRAALENIVERTPGSFIEEKEFSIAWHYRQIDKDLGEKRLREFRDVLLYLTANSELHVLEGNKVVEVKHAGVTKGKATLNWLQMADWDFILAIGDDKTDEDMFRVLPAEAFSIKIGMENSEAKYHLVNTLEVREFLNQLVHLRDN
jgi:trehalose 6-phosphate synthase/phosphatase